MLDLGAGEAGKAELVKNGSDASFMADVVEESRRRPVIVDFWAPWCGPCRQLTPVIEKAVQAAKGAVTLVKINIDENPRIAGQLRVQSIPAVYAFADGQPVDGFLGALPESQVKAFIDRLTGGGEGGGDDVEALLTAAAEALELGDAGGAAQAYAEILQLDPKNVKAIAGLARVYLLGGDVERAQEVVALAPEGANDPDLAAVVASLSLAQEAAGETAEFERRLAADAEDHEARLELSKILAGRGQLQEAADHLLSIIEKDRAWNDDAARKQLLTVFEAAGPGSEVAKIGRRRLSSLLFA
jgi:putative thioredoxin